MADGNLPPVRGINGKPLEDGEARRIAGLNVARYEYAKLRGHVTYCEMAAKNERMYLGGGHQWEEGVRQEYEDAGKLPVEVNEIADAVNTALGNQIQNRVTIAYRPRGAGATDTIASTLSRVAMQVCDNNDFSHVETEVAADGFIQQRGYFEIRVDWNENLFGEIKLYSLDPMDVIPDPDAKSYNPESWNDVTITRWLSLDEVEATYGEEARRRVEAHYNLRNEHSDEDFGEDELDAVRRAKFGMENAVGETSAYGGYVYWDGDPEDEDAIVMVRILDRQWYRNTMCECALYPTGDIRIMEDMDEIKRQAAINAGAILFQKTMRRVRWTVSTYGDCLLHDSWSPYQRFTVVPFFPYFRRGQTRGLVDNAIGPQDMLNKALTQYLHIISTTANSGWIVEENSLANMSPDDLETEGSVTGLVLEYKKGTTRPEKIQANTIPTGVDRLIQLGSQKIRTVTGISDAIRGQGMAGQSGRAIQSLQFGSQLSMAVPLDNLARTRHMVAKFLLELIQQYMNVPQVMRIAKMDDTGDETNTEEVYLNWVNEIGEVLNDLTLGEYDAVVSEQPNQVTFENSQYEQLLDMKAKGAPIPWSAVVRVSSVANRNELARALREQEQAGDPVAEAASALQQAQAAFQRAQAVTKGVEALFSAVRTSALIRNDPALAGIADTIARSAGFIDADPAPIFPDASGLPPAPAPQYPVPNGTNPATPDNPNRGVTAGIENGNTQPTQE